MGIPDLFRWLRQKYPLVYEDCVEACHEGDQATVGHEGDMKMEDHEGGQQASPKLSNCKDQRNGLVFDNLYVDMNHIIHCCCHPKCRPAPDNPDEMIAEILNFIDRIFAIVCPRRLVYLAVDGVPPRAKANQQRVRRFREVKRSAELLEDVTKIRALLRVKGRRVPDDKPGEQQFDSNCITPGTEFMAKLSVCLSQYVQKRLSTDPDWANVIAIVSDANVPGEGEHKIMDFIRRQRARPEYDVNLRHCLFGSDGDLILLGLATHETHFSVIRDRFVYNKPSMCHVCLRLGHRRKDCIGGAPKKTEPEPVYGVDELVFVHLPVLREYLRNDIVANNSPVVHDFERAIDDWVFMCLLIKNDFLPSLPSLSIREGAIDRIVGIYKNVFRKTGLYLCENGKINIACLRAVLSELGALEDGTFKGRHDAEQRFAGKSSDDDEGDRLWLDGWKDRYYRNRFGSNCDAELRRSVSLEYLTGLHWVLMYYYQRCSSWTWHYPHHYAPFVSDLVGECSLNDYLLDKTGDPLLPLEHLISVLPAASKDLVPGPWQKLMDSSDSPLNDMFECSSFKRDLSDLVIRNDGGIELPFVDETRLLQTLRATYPYLSAAELARNSVRQACLYVGPQSTGYVTLKELCSNDLHPVTVDPTVILGLGGTLAQCLNDCDMADACDDNVNANNSLQTSRSVEDILRFTYRNPQYKPGYVFSTKAPKDATDSDHKTKVERIRKQCSELNDRQGGRSVFNVSKAGSPTGCSTGVPTEGPTGVPTRVLSDGQMMSIPSADKLKMREKDLQK